MANYSLKIIDAQGFGKSVGGVSGFKLLENTRVRITCIALFEQQWYALFSDAFETGHELHLWFVHDKVRHMAFFTVERLTVSGNEISETKYQLALLSVEKTYSRHARD